VSSDELDCITSSGRAGGGGRPAAGNSSRLFNAGAVLALNTTYGPRWQQPLTILSGRFVKFGVHVDF
jgi:hypothetical protein